MPATNEELEKMIEQLREQVATLQDGFEKFQALLAQVVETKQLNAEAIESTSIAASTNQGLGLGANTRTNDVYIDPSGNVGFGVTQPLNSLHVARLSHLNAIFDRTDTSDHLTVVVGSDGSGLRFSDSNFFFIGTQPYNERNDKVVFYTCGSTQTARPNSWRLMNNPITVSCKQMDLEKQFVLRANRLIRVLNVKCFRSIFWVFALPTV